MKTILIFATLLTLSAGLAAQQTQTTAPPVPPLAAPPTPLATAPAADGAGPVLPSALAPNPNALRVYVQTLQGPDANQIVGLIEQELFDSKQVVVTENANNASLILKGVIYRQPIPEPKTAKARRRQRSRRRAGAAAQAAPSDGVTFVNPRTIPGVNSTAPGDATATLPALPAADDLYGGASGSGFGAGGDLPSLSSLLNPGITDLRKYQYRVDLELVDPDGDLIWLSGRGIDAPSFAAAASAVQTSLQPMLDLLQRTAKSARVAAPPAAR